MSFVNSFGKNFALPIATNLGIWYNFMKTFHICVKSKGLTYENIYKAFMYTYVRAHVSLGADPRGRAARYKCGK